MNGFAVDRIFKRSENNKSWYFGADIYYYPLMFYLVEDDFSKHFIIYQSEEERAKNAKKMVDECNTENPSITCLWNMAVLSFYGNAMIDNPFKKDVALTKNLLRKIYKRKNELLVDDWEKRNVYKQLYDFRSYINNSNVLNEISWNLIYMDEHDCDPTYCVYGDIQCVENCLLSELPALGVEEGWHLAINPNQMEQEGDTYYFRNKGILKLYALDGAGRKDNDFFKHLRISNSEVGGWCLLLFLACFFHVTVHEVLKNAYHFCPYVKTEKEIMEMCISSCTTDLYRPDEYLPYGNAVMIDENRCLIDIVFEQYFIFAFSKRRVHATILLNNNRLEAVALKVYDKD